MEQIPEGRSKQEVEEEIDATCCLCHNKWTVYRGQFSCSSKLCGVPVIVCSTCAPHANQSPQALQCDLCQSNYRAPKHAPDLVAIKRKAEERVKQQQSQMQNDNPNSEETDNPTKKNKLDHPEEYYPDRLFLSRLPLTVTATKLKQVLLPAASEMTVTTVRTNKQSTDRFRVHWLRDPRTNAFYGSCIVQMPNEKSALHALTVMDVAEDNNNKTDASSHPKRGYRIDKKRIRVSRMKKLGPRNDESSVEENKSKFDDIFSKRSYQEREYPPIQ